MGLNSKEGRGQFSIIYNKLLKDINLPDTGLLQYRRNNGSAPVLDCDGAVPGEYGGGEANREQQSLHLMI